MKPVVITAEVIDTYDQAGYVRNMETYGLRNMIKALSIMELLNTEEENQRLARLDHAYHICYNQTRSHTPL